MNRRQHRAAGEKYESSPDIEFSVIHVTIPFRSHALLFLL